MKNVFLRIPCDFQILFVGVVVVAMVLAIDRLVSIVWNRWCDGDAMIMIMTAYTKFPLPKRITSTMYTFITNMPAVPRDSITKYSA